MRFDFILVVLLTLTIIFGNKDIIIYKDIKSSKIHKIITILLIYVFVTLPFVEWPGSVLHYGLETFIKAIVFYYFTIFFVTDENKLNLFIFTFVACQSFRFLEPLFLHITQGYWGSFASMSNWEYMDRLAGAPHDIVNPNGLAFIILTVIPFLYFLSKISISYRVAATFLLPLSIYTLLLTGSRSGLLGFFVILLGIFLKSKNKAFLLIIIFAGGIISYNCLGDNFRDRYKSIFVSDTKNAASAEGRIEGTKKALLIALRKPLFGHGLSTSREANANFGLSDQPAHNLYAEVAQELGFVGVVIFITLLIEIMRSFDNSMVLLSRNKSENQFLLTLNNSMRVWLYMNLLFSLASYGLTSYEWYLFAGLSLTLQRLTKLLLVDSESSKTNPHNILQQTVGNAI